MSDLDVAKNRLYDESLTLVIVKNGKAIYETHSHRISGFLEAIDTLGEGVRDSSVADRVVGKAVALLCVYAKVKSVYAVILSRHAKTVFEKHKIAYQSEELVDNVLDSNRAGVCPFEKAAVDLSAPKDAYEAFKRLHRSLRQCR
jgi:Domain of unknown function (DUF1893)